MERSWKGSNCSGRRCLGLQVNDESRSLAAYYSLLLRYSLSLRALFLLCWNPHVQKWIHWKASVLLPVFDDWRCVQVHGSIIGPEFHLLAKLQLDLRIAMLNMRIPACA